MSWKKPTLSMAGWAFGLSFTIVLIALWGRAVVVDTDTLAESLAPLSGSSTVVDTLADWAGDELIDAGVDPSLVDPTIEYLLESTSVGMSFENLVVDVVDAAASTNPAGSTVDVATHLEPAVPEIVAGLTSLGFEMTVGEVSAILGELDPFQVREAGAMAIVGPESPAASRLGTATWLGLLGISGFGYAVVALSDDRIRAIRELLTRIAVGGFTFAILLRLGAWVLDPSGGRAPIPETLSSLANSKWMVPFWVALVSGLVAVSIFLGRRWLRREEVSRSTDEQPTPTREPQLSLSGSGSGSEY